MSPADRGLCLELVYGVVRRQATLDWLIARKTQDRPQKEALRILLQLGLYQIFWLDRVPDHAAVHETVQLARELGFGAQAGFINAVLRGYTREKEKTLSALATLKSDNPSVAFSHPQWLVDQWQKRWGAETAAQLMEWNNQPPKTFARLNTIKTDADALLTRWREEENIEYDLVRAAWLPECLMFELKSHPPLQQMKTFQEGCFYIQDPGTIAAVLALDPQPGETILDLCAAPGGKTTFIAQLMRNEGRIIAQEINPDRLKLLRENCHRLGATCVQSALPSTLDPRPSTLNDRILIDAPCSNTGVLRRRIDLRWRIQPQEIERLRKTQLDLLHQAAGLLKPGGTLVYSTCSLESEENAEVVQQFLESNPQFKLEQEQELLPFRDRVDGAYTARITAPTSP
jgi:16S rRNA (cytosine967-C5)-methyltransferase